MLESLIVLIQTDRLVESRITDREETDCYDGSITYH